MRVTARIFLQEPTIPSVLSPDPDDAMLRILQPLFTDRQVVCWRHRSDQA